MAPPQVRHGAPAESPHVAPAQARHGASAQVRHGVPVGSPNVAPAASSHVAVAGGQHWGPAEAPHMAPAEAPQVVAGGVGHRAAAEVAGFAPAASASSGTRAESSADPRAAKATVQRKLASARVLLAQLTARQTAVEESAPQEAAGLAGGTSNLTRAEKAIAFARAQIGKPYVWGASGPGSYDCSGLTQAAWKSAGVALPRGTRDQAGAGSTVPLADARPGDLVFFHDDIRHVGLCTGDGMMIHAPGPGTYVREESVYHDGESTIHSVVRPS
ncbi:C40 family peptidase [Streptomyces sp. NPDC004561]